jgi:hypothetical protein
MTSKGKQAARIARLERQVVQLARAAMFRGMSDNEVAEIIRAPEIGRPRLQQPATTPRRSFNLPECSGCETPPWEDCWCAQEPAWFEAEDQLAAQHLASMR